MAKKAENDGKWWDKSITLVEGCTPISEGCKNCWSAGMAHRFHQKKGLTTDGHFNGKIICRDDRLKELMRKEPTRWTIWNDLFHPQVPFEFIDKVMIIIANCKQHSFLVLTKRPQRMLEYFKDFLKEIFEANKTFNKHKLDANLIDRLQKHRLVFRNFNNFPPDHLHLGVTVCTPDELPKIDILRIIPAAHRFVCLEPLLGSVIIKDAYCNLCVAHNCELHGIPQNAICLKKIDWVIVGCESLGGRAGRFQEGYAEAALDIIRQCKAAGVLVWHKQMPINGKVSHDMAEWPVEFRIQQYER